MGQRIKPQDQMDTQDLTAGQGPVSDPAGIAAAGGTPDQAKMAGTPVQVQSNIEMQKRAQDQRLVEQEQAAAAEQQRLAGETLAQQQRYERPSPATEGQKQAAEIAQTLNTLGPVRTRVQSLIQERLQAAQAAATNLQINETAIAAIQDPDKRQAAQSALSAYITSPTEENLQKIYDAIGSEKTEDLQQFFTTPEGTVQESFQEVFGATNVTLSTLGIPTAALAKIAEETNIPLQQLQGMTLDQLNQQIAAIEAAELNRVDQLKAQLEDPALTPAMREAIIDELRQLGAAGVIEAEADIEVLQEQIDAAGTVNVLGREMPVEKLLSDEGLSSLVAQAVTNPEMLQAMKDDPEYAALAGWIEQNAAALSILAAEYEERGEEFVDLQDKYKELKESLGADGLELLQSIYGEKFASSVLSGELEDIKAKLEATPLYRMLTKKGNEKYVALLKEDPELAKQIMESGFEDTEIEYVFDLKERIDQDSYFSTILSTLTDKELPKGGYIFDQDIMDSIRKNDTIEIYDSLDPTTIAAGKDVQDLLGTDKSYFTLKDLQILDDSKNKDKIVAGIKHIINEQKDFNKNIKSVDDEGNITYNVTKMMDRVFGENSYMSTLMKKLDSLQDDEQKLKTATDYVKDLNAVLEDIPEDQKKTILSIFDTDDDGTIEAEELTDQKVGERLEKALGIKTSKDDVLIADGEWQPPKIPVVEVTGHAFETKVKSNSLKKMETLLDERDKRDRELTTQYPQEAIYKNIAEFKKEQQTTADNFNNSKAYENRDTVELFHNNGFSDMITELGNLRGFSKMSPYGKEGATQILYLLESPPLSKEDQKIFEDASRKGFSRPEFDQDGNVTNLDQMAKERDIIEEMAKRMSLIEERLATFIGHIQHKRSSYKNWLGQEVEGHRIAKNIEKMRDSFVKRVRDMTALRDSYNSNIYSLVGGATRYSEFYKKKTALDKKSEQLNSWSTQLDSYNKDNMENKSDELDELSGNINKFSWD